MGVGILGQTLFKSKLPLDVATGAGPDAVMALIPVPGLPPAHVHTQQQAAYEQPVVQVHTRGIPYDDEECMQRAMAAFLALDGLANITLSGVWYLWVQAMQSPYTLYTDELARPHVIFTVRCARSMP